MLNTLILNKIVTGDGRSGDFSHYLSVKVVLFFKQGVSFGEKILLRSDPCSLRRPLTMPFILLTFLTIGISSCKSGISCDWKNLASWIPLYYTTYQNRKILHICWYKWEKSPWNQRSCTVMKSKTKPLVFILVFVVRDIYPVRIFCSMAVPWNILLHFCSFNSACLTNHES